MPPCRAHVVVIDGLSFSSTLRCRTHVVVIDATATQFRQCLLVDGNGISRVPYFRVHVVVVDGIVFPLTPTRRMHAVVTFRLLGDQPQSVKGKEP